MKTWEHGSEPTNFMGKRALDRTSAEANKMWCVGGIQSPPIRVSSWGDRTASRALGTTYTNGGRVRLVILSVALTAPGVVSGTTYGGVRAVADPAGANVLVGRVAIGSTVTSGGRSKTKCAFLFVNPGEQYRFESFQEGSNGNVTVSVTHWYEFDFDGAHPVQTYALGEQPTTTKLNTYAKDVNNVGRADTNATAQAHGLTEAEELTVGNAALFIVTVPVSVLAVVNDWKIEQRDSGGALAEVGRADANFGGTGNGRETIACLVNRAGGVIVSRVSGSSALANSGQRFIFQTERTTADAITFTDGESGAATAQKWKDLDGIASRGINATEPWARTQRGGHVGNGAGPFSVQPSTTRASVVIVWTRHDVGPTGETALNLWINNGVADLLVGNPSAPGGTSWPDEETMTLAMCHKNFSYKTRVDGAGSVEQRTDWVIP